MLYCGSDTAAPRGAVSFPFNAWGGCKYMTRKTRDQGAQPGNTNALKHGFYSPRFKKGEVIDLESALANGLDDEVSMLRVITRRLFDLSDGETDPEKLAATVGTLGAAATRLAGLMRTQSLIQGSGASSMDILSEALKEVSDELGLK